MTDSFKGDLDEWLEGYIGGDVYVTSLVPIRENVVRRIATVPGVEAVAPVRYFEVEWRLPGKDWETVNFMAFDPSTYSQVTSFVFSQSTPDSMAKLSRGGHVFISSVIAGATSAEQVRANTAAADGWRLTEAEMTEVSALLKGEVA